MFRFPRDARRKGREGWEGVRTERFPLLARNGTAQKTSHFSAVPAALAPNGDVPSERNGGRTEKNVPSRTDWKGIIKTEPLKSVLKQGPFPTIMSILMRGDIHKTCSPIFVPCSPPPPPPLGVLVPAFYSLRVCSISRLVRRRCHNESPFEGKR